MAKAKTLTMAAPPKPTPPPAPAPVQMKAQPSPAPTPQISYPSIAKAAAPMAAQPQQMQTPPRQYNGGIATAVQQPQIESTLLAKLNQGKAATKAVAPPPKTKPIPVTQKELNDAVAKATTIMGGGKLSPTQTQSILDQLKVNKNKPPAPPPKPETAGAGGYTPTSLQNAINIAKQEAAQASTQAGKEAIDAAIAGGEYDPAKLESIGTAASSNKPSTPPTGGGTTPPPNTPPKENLPTQGGLANATQNADGTFNFYGVGNKLHTNVPQDQIGKYTNEENVYNQSRGGGGGPAPSGETPITPPDFLGDITGGGPESHLKGRGADVTQANLDTTENIASSNTAVGKPGGAGGRSGPGSVAASVPGAQYSPASTLAGEFGSKTSFANNLTSQLGVSIKAGGKKDAYSTKKYGKGSKGLAAAQADVDAYNAKLGGKTAQAFVGKNAEGMPVVKFNFKGTAQEVTTPDASKIGGGTGIPGPIGETIASAGGASTAHNEFVTHLYDDGGFMDSVKQAQLGLAKTFGDAQTQIQGALKGLVEGSPQSEADVQDALDAFSDTAQRELDIDFRNNVRAVNQDLTGAGLGNSSFLPQMLANGATRNYVLGMTDIANKRSLLNEQVRDSQSARRNNQVKTMLGVAAPSAPSMPGGEYPQPGTFQAPASQADFIGMLQNMAIGMPLALKGMYLDYLKSLNSQSILSVTQPGGINLGGIGGAVGGIAGAFAGGPAGAALGAKAGSSIGA